MSYLVLARKWRPKTFDDLAGQEPITRILKNALSQRKTSHAYIFSGPRGVGKTSAARILAKALNCKEGPTDSPCCVCESCNSITEGSSVDVIEIDGASNNSVDDIRDLREKVKYAPSGGKYKVYIIDEVHMLSNSAFNALLKTLEEPPSHVIFVLATTEMKKIPATVLSRCQHMPFRRISSGVIKSRLKLISETEGIKISAHALSLIAKAADGSMRDSLTILDQISSFTSEINEDSIQNLLGITDFGLLTRVARALIKGDRTEIIETINLLSEQGADFRAFTRDLTQFFRDILVASVMKNPADVLDLNIEELSAVKDLVSSSSQDQLMLMLSEIMKAEGDIRGSSLPRMALEMSLMRASFLSTLKPVREVIENLDKYSRMLSGHQPSEPAPNVSTEKLQVTEAANPESVQPEILEEEIKTEEADAPYPDSDTVSVSDGTQDILSAWQKTLESIDAPLASKISGAGISLHGNELLLTLSSRQAIFENTIRNNLKILENSISSTFGRTVKIKIMLQRNKDTNKKKLKEDIMLEPLVKDVLELFEGKVIEVISENKNNGGDHV